MRRLSSSCVTIYMFKYKKEKTFIINKQGDIPMKNLLLTLLILLTIVMSVKADGQDTLWFRIAGAGVQELDFTPDDKYVIAWTNAIEFWEVQQGVKEFSIPIDINAVGDYDYTEQYLVFAKDSTPKLLDWKTKEVIEGFEKEEENIGRIRTAKSKNEFMANTYHINSQSSTIVGNKIYFYDIESKRKVDSLSILNQFEKDGYKWKRTIHDYNYVGTNDEIIYVVIDDVNDEIVNIPAQLRKRHYFVHFYNRETKELVDSVYSFTNTNTQFGGFNKMQVMNDRSKIAWNNNGGEINFYDFNTKQFYENLVFEESDFAEPNDIELINNDSYLILASSGYIKSFELFNESKYNYFNVGTYNQCMLSNDRNLMVGSIGSILILHPITKTEVESINYSDFFNISPNPSTNIIEIQCKFSTPSSFILKLTSLNGSTIDIIKNTLTKELNVNEKYSISNLSSGVYFIILETEGIKISKQFIKE